MASASSLSPSRCLPGRLWRADIQALMSADGPLSAALSLRPGGAEGNDTGLKMAPPTPSTVCQTPCPALHSVHKKANTHLSQWK